MINGFELGFWYVAFLHVIPLLALTSIMIRHNIMSIMSIMSTMASLRQCTLLGQINVHNSAEREFVRFLPVVPTTLLNCPAVCLMNHSAS